MVLRSSFSSIPSLRGSWWGITLFSPICVVFSSTNIPFSRRLFPSWNAASVFDVFVGLQRPLDKFPLRLLPRHGFVSASVGLGVSPL